jgi:ABC-type ATPase with predicted acetyltransferase domain
MSCASCDEEGMMEEIDCYRHYGGDQLFDDGDYNYYESDCTSVTVWRCSECGEYTSEEPETTTRDTWVCGSCGWKSSSEIDAMRCCL